MLSVLPSGGDLIIADVPTMPPAPGWFSTTTEAPSAVDSACDEARVIVSTPDAVATGRMKRTTLVWPCAMLDQSVDAPSCERRSGRSACGASMCRVDAFSFLSPCFNYATAACASSVSIFSFE